MNAFPLHEMQVLTLTNDVLSDGETQGLQVYVSGQFKTTSPASPRNNDLASEK